LIVTVADSAQKRWGFQLTARKADNPKIQAGSFAPVDGQTQVICASEDLLQRSDAPCPVSMPLQYVEHTGVGSRLGQTGAASFELAWTPPATDVGPVTIYVAGNGADGDNSPAHDHIYAATYTVVGRIP
jgi:hypothetical protein